MPTGNWGVIAAARSESLTRWCVLATAAIKIFAAVNSRVTPTDNGGWPPPTFCLQDDGGNSSARESPECQDCDRWCFQPLCHDGHAHQVCGTWPSAEGLACAMRDRGGRSVACILHMHSMMFHQGTGVTHVLSASCCWTRRQQPSNWTALNNTFHQVATGVSRAH